MAGFGEATHVEVGTASSAETRRIAEANGGTLGLSNEQAAEVLKAKGILPPNADGTPNYTAAIQPSPEAAHPQDAPIAAAEFARMSLPPLLASVVATDLVEAGTVEPEKIEATYQHSSRSYATDTADAQTLLDHAGSKLRASQLPARSLRHLAEWARHIRPRRPS